MDLRYMNEAVEAALANPPDKKVVKKSLGPFEMAFEEAVSPDYSFVQKDRENLTARLKAAGITPLAVLPKRWWDSIAAKSGLINGLDARNNPVEIHHERYAELVIQVRTLARLISIGTAIFSFGAAAAIILTATSIWSLLGFVACVAVAFTEFSLRKKIRGMIANMIIKNNGEGYYIANSINSGKWSWDNIYSYHLPDPDPESARVISRAMEERSLSLKVAADPRAITLTPSIRQKLFKDIEEEDRRRREMLLDPIVYVEEGSVVAIIAQYGDFSIEKEAVDQAVLESLY